MKEKLKPEKLKLPKNYIKIKRSNLRKTVIYVLERLLKKIKNKTVLEIGCGDWDFAKNILEKNGCTWYGVDVVPGISNIIGEADDIPLPDESVDVVLCSQTAEHWYEYGVSFDMAFKEINRVLKEKGELILNSPVHYHGHPWFLLGKIGKLMDKCESYFSNVHFYGCYSKKEKCWRKLSSKGFWSHVGFPDFLFQKKSFSYQLFIIGFKNSFIANYEYVPNKQRFRIINVAFRFMKEMIKNL